MSAEELWLRSYRSIKKRGGLVERLPPHSHRMARRSSAEQWAASIDLAIEIVTGQACWRHATIIKTGERYWFFRGEWWLLSRRLEKRARLLVGAANLTEIKRSAAKGSALVDSRDTINRLRRWKLSRRWQRIAALVPPLKRRSTA